MAVSSSPRKLCPVCRVEKALDDFPKKGVQRNGEVRYGYCKTCHNDYQRVSKLKRLFNLTPEEYELILAFQGGVCAICQRPPKEGGARLAVDHNHKTGQIRGLLCWICNISVGRFKDDAERLVRAAEYVTHPPASAALGEDRFGRVGRTTNKSKKRRRV